MCFLKIQATSQKKLKNSVMLEFLDIFHFAGEIVKFGGNAALHAEERGSRDSLTH